MVTFEKCVICPMSAANFALLDSSLPEIEIA
jgi:hypothetical protein